MNYKNIILNLTVTLILVCLFLGVQALTPVIDDVNIGLNDPTYTNTVSQTLYLNADANATKMRFDCTTTYSMSYVDYATTYSFDLNSTTHNCNNNDGSKTVYFEVCDSDAQDRNCSTANDSITLDRVAPSTSSNYDGTWQNSNISITLTCNDATSDCNKTYYRLDTDASNSVSYGSWTEYSSITITSDGNFAVDFNSTDKAGNVETTNTIYALRDTLNPTGYIRTPSHGSSVTSYAVEFDVNHIKDANINIDTIRIDLNGTTSTSFDADNNCTASDKNAVCSYNEMSIDRTGDYNLTVIANDAAGNTGQFTSIFSYTDSTAPTSSPTPYVSADENCAGNTIIRWSPLSSPPYDLNGFKVCRGSVSTFDCNHETIIGKANSSATNYTDSTTVADNNYYYRLQAFDYSDNNAAQSNSVLVRVGTCTAPSTPSVSSSTHSSESSWYAADDVNLSWSAVSGADTYYYVLDQTSSTTPTTSSTSTTSTSVTFSDKADGTWYFHIIACSGSTCSSADHYTINVDDTAPSAPSGLSISVSGATVSLDWSDASDTSGITKYYVYRGTSSNPTSKLSSEPTSSSFSETLSSSGTYYYRVKAINEAGLASDYSSEVSSAVTVTTTTTTDTTCDYTITLDVSDYVSLGEKTLKATTTANMHYASLKVKVNLDGNIATTTLASNQSGVTEISGTYTFVESEEGKARLLFFGEDDDGDSCNKTKDFVVDASAPTLAWKEPLANASLKDEAWLKVEATDTGSGVEKVSFYYGETKISSTSTHANNVYSVLWDVSDLNNGIYTLKAKATDKAGNSTEKLLGIKVMNMTAEEELADKAINAADANKLLIEDLVSYLNGQSLPLPETLSLGKSEADALLAEAKTLFADENFSSAETKAKQASDKYASLEGLVEVEITESDEFEFEKTEEKIKAMFSELGLQESLMEEAVSFATENGVNRKLNVIKLVENGTESYNINIVLTYSNDTNSDQNIQIIEVIPKTFALNADNLVSNTAFTVVEEDPVIKFDLEDVAPGKEIEITYGLKNAVTKTEAEKMIEQGIIKNFKAPPLVLKAETSFTKESVKLEAAPFDYTLILIIIVIVFVIALLIIVGGGLMAYKRYAQPEETERRPRFAYRPEEKEEKSFSGLFKKKEKEGLERFA